MILILVSSWGDGSRMGPAFAPRGSTTTSCPESTPVGASGGGVRVSSRCGLRPQTLPQHPGPSWRRSYGALPVTGLERSAHVLEKGGKVFSATLGLVDIVKGTNSYYKLQLLEDDKGSRCVLGRGARGAVLQERGPAWLCRQPQEPAFLRAWAFCPLTGSVGRSEASVGEEGRHVPPARLSWVQRAVSIGRVTQSPSSPYIPLKVLEFLTPSLMFLHFWSKSSSARTKLPNFPSDSSY